MPPNKLATSYIIVTLMGIAGCGLTGPDHAAPLAGIKVGDPVPSEIPREVEHLGLTWKVGVSECDGRVFSVALLRDEQPQLDATRLESDGLLPNDDDPVDVHLGPTGKLPATEIGVEKQSFQKWAEHVRVLNPRESALVLSKTTEVPCYGTITGKLKIPPGKSRTELSICIREWGSEKRPVCQYPREGGVVERDMYPGEFEVYAKYPIFGSNGMSTSDSKAWGVDEKGGKAPVKVVMGEATEIRFGDWGG